MKISEIAARLPIPDFSKISSSELKKILQTLQWIKEELQEKNPTNGYVCFAFDRVHQRHFIPGGHVTGYTFISQRMAYGRCISESCYEGISSQDLRGYIDGGQGIVGRAIVDNLKLTSPPSADELHNFKLSITEDDGSPLKLHAGPTIRIAWIEKIIRHYQ